MMHPRLMALPTLGALFALSFGPAPAATAPTPAKTPLRTISHVYATRLCTGLRRSIGPAVGKVLQNDRAIEISRPLFQSFAKNSSNGSKGATDMDVMRMERLITPMVKNTQDIEKFLSDTIFPTHPQTDADKQLVAMRVHLLQVLAQQKHALDLISGFVDTQNMAELQSAGHEYDKAIGGTDARGSMLQKNGGNSSSTQTSPTAAPAPILNAGVDQSKDPARKADPRFTNTGSNVGYNPLNVFDQQMGLYQTQIQQTESKVSQAIFKAIPECGGQVPAQPSPAPAAPVPAPSPAASMKP